MSLWEYKVITSGKGGFATPALLEKFLNDLGRDEWEIVSFHTAPDNFLAFTGLVRRPTQRDWTLEDAAAAAAKAEADKLRAEFEAKFKAANEPARAAEERAPSFLEEKVAPDDGFRKLVDTSHDAEPEDEEEAKADAWDKLVAEEEDELPTFFEAIKPHMRRNQRGPGMSVGVDYLAKKWDQSEEDLKGALAECGFVIPADEDAKPEYLEYDGDLYWINVNRRGELWINTKEKPRPVFRSVKAQRVAIEEAPKPEPEAKPETGDRKPAAAEAMAGKPETDEPARPSEIRNPKSEISKAPLPEGAELLAKIRPHMRRNRRGPGGSGSTSFLSRALRTNETELKAAFTALGLTLPSSPSDKPVYTEVGNEVWWLNLDSRGGLWINGREKKAGEVVGAAADTATPAETVPGAAAPEAVPAPEVAPSVHGGAGSLAEGGAEPIPSPLGTELPPPPAGAASMTLPVAEENIPPAAAPFSQPESSNVLGAVRLVLKETKTGAIAGKVERVAEELGKSADEVTNALVGAGLKVPEKPREKPVFVEHAGEIFWFNKNAKGELWVNAKASKFADKDETSADEAEEAEVEGSDGEKKPRRGGRGRGRKTEGAS
jgi:hypothetical protein